MKDKFKYYLGILLCALIFLGALFFLVYMFFNIGCGLNMDQTLYWFFLILIVLFLLGR